METILQSVSTVGFPIAMCLLCYYTQITTLKELRETISKNTEAIISLTAITEKWHKENETHESKN